MILIIFLMFLIVYIFILYVIITANKVLGVYFILTVKIFLFCTSTFYFCLGVVSFSWLILYIFILNILFLFVIFFNML